MRSKGGRNNVTRMAAAITTGMAKEALKSAKAVGKKATGGGSKTPPRARSAAKKSGTRSR